MDLDRLYKIANQEIDPETNEEAAFYVGYLAAVSARLLDDICKEIKTVNLTRKEIDHFLFGYGLGQRYLEEFLNFDDNKTLH